MSGRTVEIQIVLTAGRVKTSAMLGDSTPGVNRQRDSRRLGESPNVLFFPPFVFNWTASNSIHFSLCRRTQMKRKAYELYQVEHCLTRLQHRVCVCVCAQALAVLHVCVKASVKS